MSRSALTPFVISQATGVVNDNIFRNVFAFTAASAVTGSTGGSDSAAFLGLLFMIPFVVLTPLAGAIADRFPVHIVARVVRVGEVPVVAVGMLAFALSSWPLMLVTLVLLGVQSALFTPTKYAAPAQLVDSRELPRANGWLQGSVAISILLGTILSSVVDPRLAMPEWLPVINPLVLLISVAAVMLAIGLWQAWRIPPQKPLDPHSSLWRMDTLIDPVRTVARQTPLILAVLGVCMFWCTGAIAMACLPALVSVEWGRPDDQATYAFLNTLLGVGIAIGALLAGRLYNPSRQAGLPLIGLWLLGAAILGVGLTGPTAESMPVALWLTTAGIAGGLLIVPLTTVVQQVAVPHLRGQAMAGFQLAGSVGTILGFALIYAFGGGVKPSLILVVTGMALLTLATAAILIGRWQVIGQLGLWCLRLRYRVRIHGRVHLPQEGGCVLVANHASFADGPVLTAALPRRLRALVHGPYVDHPIIGRLLRAFDVISVSDGNGAAKLRQTLEAATKAAQAGQAVLIFPEGMLSRGGHVNRFQAGAGRIAERAGVPVIPIHIEGLQDSFLSRNSNKRWRWGRHAVDIRIGQALPPGAGAAAQRQAVVDLGATTAIENSREDHRTLAGAALRTARRHPFHDAVIDPEGSLSRWKLMGAALALRSLRAWDENDERVGILLPPGRAGAMANLAVACSGQSAVNINHTMGTSNLAETVKRSGVRTIISAQRYLKRIEVDTDALPADLVMLEDLKPRLGTLTVLRWMLGVYLLPSRMLVRARAADEALLIFSSGSTAVPKGVRLAHRNILANCDAIQRHLGVESGVDRIFAPLPLFHSFGTTVGLWLGLVHDICTVNAPDPRDGKMVGRMVAEHAASFLVSTPTFVRGYMRRVDPEQFRSLRFAVVGAEQCPSDLRQAFRERYNADLLEGYGATELGPVVTCSLPDIDTVVGTEHRQRDGSVGRPLPGVSVLVVGIEDRQPLEPGNDGRLLVRSPARMRDYLGEPERTADVLFGDAYDTGDVGHIDEDGFLSITGRVARFAKIGGEMVPLDRVEEAVAQRAQDLQVDVEVAVAAVADDRRGERLVVMHTEGVDGKDLVAELDHLPPIFRPKCSDVVQVLEIPVLGTGKRDLKRIQSLAEQEMVG